MDWVIENWFFILFAVLFISMHLFGFGCGGHGGHGKHGRDEESDEYKGHSDEGLSDKKGGGACH